MTPLTSVLIVDDEAPIRELMARWVASLGLQACTTANAEEAMERLASTRCDLAIVDIVMPGKNGLWLAGELRRAHPETAVVLATGNAAMLHQPPPPVADLLIKPFKKERFMLAVDRGREWRRQAVEELEWQAHLSREVRARVADIQWAVAKGRAEGRCEKDVLCELAAVWMPDVLGHTERVVRYTSSIARELNLAPDALDTLEEAALFHDIGKMAMPEAVLTKPSPLTPGEAVIMRAHVDAGADVLNATMTLRAAAPVVLASHEWFGGSGYPRGLAGHAIPIASRIIAVADAYDAMTQDRRYRSRLGAVEAASELLRCSPGQFDPDVVVAFLNIVNRH
jgi:putative nucleotidyltransferase with HDIG domain